MRFFKVALALGSLASLCLALARQPEPVPLIRADLSGFAPHELKTGVSGTLTFLTDETLAVAMCANLRCNLGIFVIRGNSIHLQASQKGLDSFAALFRVPHGGVAISSLSVAGKRAAVLYDSHLLPSGALTNVVLEPWNVSNTGATFVSLRGSEQWAAYRVDDPNHAIRQGAGELLAVTDELIAYRENGLVKIVRLLDGKAEAAFPVTPKGPKPVLRFLGNMRIWYWDSPHPTICDLSGNTLRELPVPEGWGFRIGQSATADAVLYDLYTTHLSASQQAEQILGDAVGVPVPTEANGELVRVFGSSTGTSCFEWSKQTAPLLAGGYHADISPSGNLVAILNSDNLFIYRLPNSCKKH